MNRFQRKCVISSGEMRTSGTGQPDNTAVAELLARRWKEECPYFALHEKNRAASLHSSWLRRSDCGDLALHWSS